MINDLKVRNSGSEYWKYVDYMPLSEIVSINKPTAIQLDLDHICWPNQNYKSLNRKKCNEMRIFFTHDPLALSQAVIGDMPNEIVKNRKLGAFIQNNFKWGTDIVMTHVSKRDTQMWA